MNGLRTLGLSPADEESATLEDALWESDLTVLVEHHTTTVQESASYYAGHDRSVTWTAPGNPQVVALLITRNLAEKTFILRAQYHASLPFAQAWLIAHGCPPAGTKHDNTPYIQPADDLTARLAEQIRTSGTRYEVLKCWSYDRDWSGALREDGTLVRDTHTETAPIRLFLEHWTPTGSTYTLREGAFPDEASALAWLDDRAGPLPAVPETSAQHRVEAARSRSTPASPESTAHGQLRPPEGTRPRDPGRSR